ncbi:ChrR family anti-sigma-E factor [Celeribacter sp.]|uniref:ChrR family anti-sigma-E factor n=1 Tax=Celeribacter sp. TaxID=1890673 RepID=UPI003A8E2300
MTSIRHHIPDAMLAAYASGNLPHPFAVIVAAHVSLCETCRCALEAHNSVGGAVLDTTDTIAVAGDMKAALMAQLDAPAPRETVYHADGPLPAPIVGEMAGRKPRWRSLGMGVKQDIISHGDAGSVRLLYIPSGQAVPDHTHNGLELTLVLQGSFSDESGRFGVGDVEVADENVEHTPIADAGDPCICIAATDAPLKFRAMIPRLLQPIFRI